VVKVRHVHTWWIGLLVGVVGLALVPMPAVAVECVLLGDGFDGQPLVYRDNGDGTITDRNTRLDWEKKLAATDGACTAADQENRSVHCVNNTYDWSATVPNPDGTLFTDFLARLNNRCEKDETISCNGASDCRAVGGKCGFAGKRDWYIPNIRELQSIVDYGRCKAAALGPPCVDVGTIDPVFGPVDERYWSSTPYAIEPDLVWEIQFDDFSSFPVSRTRMFSARAVRGGCD